MVTSGLEGVGSACKSFSSINVAGKRANSGKSGRREYESESTHSERRSRKVELRKALRVSVAGGTSVRVMRFQLARISRSGTAAVSWIVSTGAVACPLARRGASRSSLKVRLTENRSAGKLAVDRRLRRNSLPGSNGM